MNFQEELADLINKHSIENDSDTPDFVLAEYLTGCLAVYRDTVWRRDMWYGYEQWQYDPLSDVPQKPEPPDIVVLCTGCGREATNCRCWQFYYGIAILAGVAILGVMMAILFGE